MPSPRLPCCSSLLESKNRALKTVGERFLVYRVRVPTWLVYIRAWVFICIIHAWFLVIIFKFLCRNIFNSIELVPFKRTFHETYRKTCRKSKRMRTVISEKNALQLNVIGSFILSLYVLDKLLWTWQTVFNECFKLTWISCFFFVLRNSINYFHISVFFVFWFLFVYQSIMCAIQTIKRYNMSCNSSTAANKKMTIIK